MVPNMNTLGQKMKEGFALWAVLCILYSELWGCIIKYHIFISVVVIELSVRFLNTGPEDRLDYFLCSICPGMML